MKLESSSLLYLRLQFPKSRGLPNNPNGLTSKILWICWSGLTLWLRQIPADRFSGLYTIIPLRPAVNLWLDFNAPFYEGSYIDNAETHLRQKLSKQAALLN